MIAALAIGALAGICIRQMYVIRELTREIAARNADLHNLNTNYLATRAINIGLRDANVRLHQSEN